jgi:methylated-DNA-[protein]-cysteine S-methyltransferase
MTVERLNKSEVPACRTTKIYCRVGCPAGKRTKPQNRVYFKSHEDARAHGYRACKICKPDSTPVEPETFYMTSCPTPLGKYAILTSPRGIVCMEPEEEIKRRLAKWQRDGIRIEEATSENAARAAAQLLEYFAGELETFDLPLDLRGTDFQVKVWQRLQEIPFGETVSYGELARSLGQDKAARPVGGAVGRNPVSIVVPCHRVVGSNGSLTGYGGGLPRKKALLALEAKNKGKKG